eukprot:6776266-Lingulodinium_polyedra.AAC.1
MPTPDIDVTNGVVDRRNLPDHEHAWNRQLAEQGQKVNRAANALERCIAPLGARMQQGLADAAMSGSGAVQDGAGTATGRGAEP